MKSSISNSRGRSGLKAIALGSLAGCMLAGSPSAFAANRVKANNTSNLNVAVSWTNPVAVPAAFDVGVWSNTVTAANAVELGGDLSFGGIAVFNPGGAVSISGSNRLTLGVYSIDMTRAAQPLSLTPAEVALMTNASVQLNVTNGQTLTLSPTNFIRSAGSVLVLTNAGTVATTTITNDATGIIGTWARYGNTTAAKYVTVSGGVLTGYAGTAAATAADVIDASGATNYDVAATGVLGAGAAFNTLRYTGAAGAIGGDFSANGLLNAGAGALNFTNNVTIGADKELVITSPDTTRSVTLSGTVSDNGGGASGVTMAGGGRVVLAGGNAYNGVTVVGAGTLAITNANSLGTTNGDTVVYSTGLVGNNGGQLSLSGGVTIAEPILIQGPGDGGFGNTYTRAIDSTAGTNAITGTITLTGTTGYRLGGSAGVMNYGLIQRSTTGGGTLILDPTPGVTVNINAAIDNNLGGLTCHGSGLVVLNASSNDLGGVTVQNGTSLKITAENALAVNQSLLLGQNPGNNGAGGVNNDVATFFMDGVSQTINALNGSTNSSANASASDKRRITNTSTNAVTLTVGNGNAGGSFNGVIDDGTNGGSIAFTKVGSGAQSFTGTRPNSYSGLTTINGGTLNLNKTAGTNAVSGNILVGGGTLANLQSHQIADTATVTLSATNAQWSLGGFAETVANVDMQNAGAADSTGLWTGTGGKLTISGTLTHSLGNIMLNSGGAGATLDVGALVNLGGVWNFGTAGATQSLLVGSGGLTIGGGSTISAFASTNSPNFIGLGGDVTSVTNAVVNTISGTAQVRLNGARTFTVADGAALIDLAVSSPLADGTSAGTLIKEGAGTLSLSGSNSYTAGTIVNAGVLSIAGTNALPGWGSVGGFGVASGATLAVGNGASDADIAAMLGTGNFAAGGNIGFDTTAGNRTYASNLVDTGAGSLGLVKLGTNTLTLSGTNTYTGMTLVQAGILSIASTNALPGWDTNGRYFVASNATLAVGTGVSSASVDTVLGTTNFAGGANIGFDTSAGSRPYGSTIGNSVNGKLGVVKVGANTLTLSGPSTYDGVTTIDRGTLLINNASALGTTNGTTVINSTGNLTAGGQLSLTGSITVAEPIVIAGPGDSGPTYSLAVQTAGGGGSNALNGPLTIATTGGARLGAAGAGTVLVINGPFKRTSPANNLQLTVGGDNGMVVVNTLIENNGGDLALPGGGRGIVQLNVASNLIGNVQIAGKHILKLGVSDALAVNRNLEIGYASTWNEADIATFDLAGFSQTVNQLYGNGTSNPVTARVITNSAASPSVLTVGNGNGSATFNGLIAGNVALTKVGTGTQTLRGTNTFTGATTVSNGTLALTGNCALASTTIAIDAGARLSVTGRVDGALNLVSGQTLSGKGALLGTANNDGTVAPGASAGTLTIAGDYVQASGVLNIELGGTVAGTNHDQLVVSNAAALVGTLAVSLIDGFTPALSNSFTILTAVGGVSGTFAAPTLPALATPGLGWKVDYLPNSVVLSVTGAPSSTGFDLYAQQITNAGDRGYASDPDSDGYVNLLEYATGGNPTNSDQTARLSAIRATNGVFTLRFTRSTNAVDAMIAVEGSYTTTNGADWIGIALNSNGVWSGAATVTEDAATPANVIVRDTEPAATNRFLRLRVTRP